MLTSEEALVAGRPQMVVPLYLEHLFTARALAALGLALIVRPSSTPQEIVAALRSMWEDPAMSLQAVAFAEAFWRTSAPPPDLPARLLDMLARRAVQR
jgi:UDP:flavonoid glycosyltransferase YjiC (YdhE family)